MRASEQGVAANPTAKAARYQVVPRTLIFITSRNPATGADELLLLKGAANKRLWANKYNGIGGHVEAGEDFLAAAQRELAEETGLTQVELALRGVLNIAVHPDGDAPSGVAVFLFTGRTAERTVRPGAEGALRWVPLAEVADLPLVDDLHHLLPLLQAEQATIYGHYQPDPNGEMRYTFRGA